MTLINEKGAAVKNGGLSVALQNNYAPPVIFKLSQSLATTALVGTVAVNDYTFEVVSVAGFLPGQEIRVIDSISARVYIGTILNIVSTTITVDSPMDFAYPEDSEVVAANSNMNINGSVTSVGFKARIGTTTTPAEIDVSRILIACTTDNAVDLGKFGDLGPLTNGIVLRRTQSGATQNIFNAKTNGELAGLGYDLSIYDATNPAQGADGFLARITFNGPDKMGVAIKLEENDNLELLVQDDLTSILSFRVILQGHAIL